MPGDHLALRSKSLELLKESKGEVLRGLNGIVGSSAKSRVDLGGSVDDVVEDGLGGLDPRCDSLHVVSLRR